MRVHWLWLSQHSKISTDHKLKLLQYFGDPENIFNADARSLKGISYMTPVMLEQLLDKDLGKAYELLSTCEKKSIGFITLTDSSYPARLRSLADPPLVLYYKGRLPDFESRPLIGIVGTRSASVRGLSAAEKLGGEIAACGGIVVSGGALGIDGQALLGAYKAGKPTVTVLAGGLDRLYPKENIPLFHELCEEGCLLSEYPPGSASFRGNFLRRNRLISGMSNGVLVVEAPKISGALNTARWASEQGKELFASPGPMGTEECAGSNELLDNGAKTASSGWAVMQTYAQRYPRTVQQAAYVPQRGQPQIKYDKKDIDKKQPDAYSVIEKQLPPLTPQEQQIVDQLKTGPVLSHTLASDMDMDTGSIMRLLTMLSMKGVVSISGSEVKLK